MGNDQRAPRFGNPKITLPAPGWNYIVDLFEAQHPSSLIDLHFAIADGEGVLRAQVASEKAKFYLIKLFEEHPAVKILSAHIVVTAPFRSAQRRDPFEVAFDSWDNDSGNALAKDDVTLIRYPSIEMIGERKVGETVVVIVYLKIEPDELTEGEPATVEGLPENWERIDVDVLLHSAQLEIALGARETVTIRRDQNSTPAYFRASVSPKAVETRNIQIDAHFFYENRRCGAARRILKLAAEVGREGLETAPPAPTSSEPKSDVRGSNSAAKVYTAPIQIEHGLKSAALIIIIDRQGSGINEQYTWATYSEAEGLGKWATSGTLDLHGTGREFAWKMIGNFNSLPSGGHERQLKGIGRKIWEATPDNFRKHYLDLVTHLGPGFPIQIFSDEPYVPWEIMLPVDPSGSREFDHLSIQHPVARWPGSNSRRAPVGFKIGMLATFVPTYAKNVLSAAKDEGKWLCQNLGGKAQNPTYDDFFNFLEKPPVSSVVQIVHFAGHGTVTADMPSSIEMMDERFVTVDEIRQTGIKLGHRDNSLFVLNACDVGASGIELGMANGWADALIGNAFGGVIAPLWRVNDEHASTMIKATLHSFLKGGETIGEAMRAARQESRYVSTTPFSYVLYGDVMARSKE